MSVEADGFHGTIQSALWYTHCQCVDGVTFPVDTGGFLLKTPNPLHWFQKQNSKGRYFTTGICMLYPSCREQFVRYREQLSTN